MRTVKTPYGKQIYKIPDEGGHRIQEAIRMANGSMRIYQYELPPRGGNNMVRISTRCLDEIAMEERVEELPERHIGDSLVAPAEQRLRQQEATSPWDPSEHMKKVLFNSVKSYTASLFTKKEQTMRFYTGQRVEFIDRGLDRVLHATVLDQVGGDAYALAVDEPQQGYDFLENILGPGRGVVVNRDRLEPVAPRSQWSSKLWYKNAPSGLAVHFPKELVVDSVLFSPHDVGRIVGQRSDSSNTLSVQWMNKECEHFSPHTAVLDKNEKVRNCYYVPLGMLRLCAVNPNTWQILHSFGQLGPEMHVFKPGDVVVYNSDKSFRAPGGEGKIINVGRGSIIRVEKDDGGGAFHGRLVGGCMSEALGNVVGVDRRLVIPFEHPWIEKGQVITVTAEITFRKRALQGNKGKVLLSTDAEGDVGVEFPEDIGAGSLDGEGKDGHCLYLPAGALKISG